MAYDYSLLVEKIIGAIAVDGTVADRMKIVIDECARQHPHPDWAIFSSIDFDRDGIALDSWLQNAFSNPKSRIASSGLWFGLFNPANASGEASADVYVGAAPEFDESSIDWAGDIDDLDAFPTRDNKAKWDLTPQSTGLPPRCAFRQPVTFYVSHPYARRRRIRIHHYSACR